MADSLTDKINASIENATEKQIDAENIDEAERWQGIINQQTAALERVAVANSTESETGESLAPTPLEKDPQEENNDN